MEQSVEEIAADAELRISGIWVAHRSELLGLEAVEGMTSRITGARGTVKEPSLRLDGNEFVVPVHK